MKALWLYFLSSSSDITPTVRRGSALGRLVRLSCFLVVALSARTALAAGPDSLTVAPLPDLPASPSEVVYAFPNSFNGAPPVHVSWRVVRDPLDTAASPLTVVLYFPANSPYGWQGVNSFSAPGYACYQDLAPGGGAMRMICTGTTPLGGSTTFTADLNGNGICNQLFSVDVQVNNPYGPATPSFCTVVDENGTLVSSGTAGCNSARRFFRFPACHPPRNLSASDSDPNGVQVSWTGVSGATSYDVIRSTAANPTQPTTIASGTTSTTFFDSSAVPGTIYNYAARANVSAPTGASSNSIFSNVDTGIRPNPSVSLSGTIRAADTQNPIGLVAVRIQNGSVDLTTSSNLTTGTYSFPNLSPGTYTVTPSSSEFSFTPRTVTIGSTPISGFDFFGTRRTFTIQGTIRDGAGTPLSGVSVRTVISVNGGQTTIVAQSQSDGQYFIRNLPSGATYSVTPSLQGYTFAPASLAVQINGSDRTGQDFTGTLVPTSFRISGTLQSSTGSGISGQTVRLSANGAIIGLVTSGSGGSYSFDAVANGTYTVTPDPAAFTFSPSSATITISGADRTNLNFVGTARPTSFRISGTLQSSTGSGISGQTVRLSANGALIGLATSGSGGSYAFDAVPNGTYTVTPDPAAFTFSPSSATITISGTDRTNLNFVGTARPTSFRISGTLQSSTGSGISGQTVRLSANGAIIGLVTSGSGGSYSFDAVANGTYTVTPDPAAFTFSPSSATITISGADRTNLNFVGTARPTSFRISGTVRSSVDGSPVRQVSITLSGGGLSRTAITDSNGGFTFTDIPNGRYSLTPALRGYSFNPSTASTEVSGGDRGSQDFTAIPACSDGIDNESPGDGLIDSADPGCSSPADTDEGDGTSECQDGLDNDGDDLVDTRDPGCTGPQDDSEGSNGISAPRNLTASDTDPTGISVRWNAAPGASTYDLYRSEDPADTAPASFPLLAGSIDGTSFFDRSAVPGRIYNYAVRGRSGSQLSAFSNVDAGLRPSETPDGDCDGDGVSDAQERIDGTGVCDAGSFVLHLKSPAFSKYNTYLSQMNFLELIADGSQPVQDVRVSVYSITGQLIASTTLTVPAQSEVDVDINSLVRTKDTYGIVKIDFLDEVEGATLKGRITNYRPDPNGTTYSFAFTKELRNPTRGDTFASANSFDPQGQGFLVPNWAEIINLDNVSRTFTYTLYNQAGTQLQQERFVLAPLAERDIQAGHENGEGAYLASVRPENGETKYFAGISRYSSNHRGGNEAATYNYAFNLEARAGNGTTQFALVGNETGTCFSQTNWLEVVNTRSSPITATVRFRGSDGREIGSSDLPLAPRSQFHFNAAALVPKGTTGSAELSSNLPGSIIAQSLVYFHDCRENRVQSAYATQTRIAGQDVQTGSVNSFLSMRNSLRLINAASTSVSSQVVIRPFSTSGPLPAGNFSLGAKEALNVLLNGPAASFAIPNDAYGTVRIQTAAPKQLVPTILRTRMDPDGSGRVDFVIPIVVQ